MANGKSEINYRRNANNAKKADIIIELDSQISAKLVHISKELDKTNAKIDAVMAEFGKGTGESDKPFARINEVYDALHEEYVLLKREMKYLAAQNENIFLAITKRLDEISALVSGGSTYSAHAVSAAPAEIDYDKLAEKVVGMLPVNEVISPDYIASKVAEQIIIPEYVAPASATAESGAAEVTRLPVDLRLDEEELADRIALKIGGIKAEDFDILVDDEGCASISEEIVHKLDYDIIASSVAEKLRVSLEYIADREPDYDEIAHHISEKINVTGLNEDSVAEKVAKAISDAMPEIDTDDIADKVASQLIESMPTAEVDSDAICNNISEKLIKNQENHDYDIVIDEDGIGQITEYVSAEIRKDTAERFDGVDRELAELKAMIGAGAAVREAATSAAETYVAEESTLVTVSEVVEDGQDEPDNEYETDLAELVEEIDEVPAEGEFTAEDLEGAAGGVDFENMMKYNRSFIARIIQSTDDQKEYYGRVKTALLSYAKVNSNIAWGAERFNKGRETIARFKIRGKTLCLYLALNPTDYPYSVYHHVDVSDNKSMHGTPMMVKIKSPRGVKKAIRLIDDMLEKRDGVKRTRSIERNYAAMYPYESIEELIEDGLVKDVNNNK